MDEPVAIVTGATGYIGRSVVRSLAARGHRVAAAYYSDDAAADMLAAEGTERILPIRADLRQVEGPGQLVRQTVETLGRPSVLVACAGITQKGAAMMTHPDAVRDVLQLDLAGQIELARLCLKEMWFLGFGRIVLVGSRAGLAGAPGQAAYAAAKAGLSGWAASVAGEVKDGITVNVVAPGALDDDSGTYTAAERETAESRIGLDRLGTAEEVAAVILFLASAEASYVHGTTIPVDGGARF